MDPQKADRMMTSQQKSALRRRLLSWFDTNRRDLPWRKRSTRYRVWVSEIMLQQTRVATVIEYYRRFLKQFPNVKALASAPQADVLKMWEGLGYYRRARQMHNAAQVIMEQHSGRFPGDFDSVLALPGIGRYTAGAILSIADDQPLPILEGNTIRLFARLTAMKSDPRAAAGMKQLWQFSESLVPRKRAGDFNQALMELGSLVCTPRNPACTKCPLKTHCPTYVQGLQDEIPASGKKTKFEDLHESVVVVAKRNGYLLRLCGEGERWTGLWDFPRYVTPASDAANRLAGQLKSDTGLVVELEKTDTRIKHAVTRFRITLDCFHANGAVRGRLKKSAQSYRWIGADELAGLAMSVTGRRIAQTLTRDQ